MTSLCQRCWRRRMCFAICAALKNMSRVTSTRMQRVGRRTATKCFLPLRLLADAQQQSEERDGKKEDDYAKHHANNDPIIGCLAMGFRPGGRTLEVLLPAPHSHR